MEIAGSQEITWCQPKAVRFDRMGPLLQGLGHTPVGAGSRQAGSRHARDFHKDAAPPKHNHLQECPVSS